MVADDLLSPRLLEKIAAEEARHREMLKIIGDDAERQQKRKESADALANAEETLHTLRTDMASKKSALPSLEEKKMLAAKARRFKDASRLANEIAEYTEFFTKGKGKEEELVALLEELRTNAANCTKAAEVSAERLAKELRKEAAERLKKLERQLSALENLLDSDLSKEKYCAVRTQISGDRSRCRAEVDLLQKHLGIVGAPAPATPVSSTFDKEGEDEKEVSKSVADEMLVEKDSEISLTEEELREKVKALRDQVGDVCLLIYIIGCPHIDCFLNRSLFSLPMYFS
mgnify:CR=1 FL=1